MSTILTLPAPATPNEMRIRSQTGGIMSNVALSFARYFHPGQIPSGSVPQVVYGGTPLPTQTAVMAMHTGGGSVKHALIDVILPSVQTTDTLMCFQPQAASMAGAAVTASDLLNDGSWDFQAKIVIEGDGQAFTTRTGPQVADARTMLTAGDVVTHRSGPICTEFIIGDLTGASHAFGVDDEESLTPIFQVKVWPHSGAVWCRYIVFGGHTESFQHQDLRSFQLFYGNTSESLVYDHETALVASGYVFPPPTPSELPDPTTRLRIRAGTARAWSGWVRNAHDTRYRFNQGPAYLRDAKVIPAGLVVDAWNDTHFEGSGSVPGWNHWQSVSPTTRTGWMGAPYRIATGMEQAGDNYNLGPLPGWLVPYLSTGRPEAYQVMEEAIEAMGQWCGFGLLERDATRTLSRANGGTHDGTLPPTAASRPAMHGYLPYNTSAGVDRPTQGPNGVPDQASVERDPVSRSQVDNNGTHLRFQTNITHWPNTPAIEWMLTGDWYALRMLYGSYSAATLFNNGAAESGIRGRGPDNTVGFAGINESPRAFAWAIASRAIMAFIAPDGDFGDEMRATMLDYAASLDGYMTRDATFTSQFEATGLEPLLDWSRDNCWMIHRSSVSEPGVPLPAVPPSHHPAHWPEVGDTTAISAVNSSPGGESEYAAPSFFRAAQIGNQPWMSHLILAGAWQAYLLGWTEFLPWCRFQAELYFIYFRHPSMRVPGGRDGRMLLTMHRQATGGFANDINVDPWRWFTVEELRDWMTSTSYVEATTGQAQSSLFFQPQNGIYTDENVKYVEYTLAAFTALEEMLTLGLYAGAGKPTAPYMSGLADTSDATLNAIRPWSEFISDIAPVDGRIGAQAPRFAGVTYAAQFETAPRSFGGVPEPTGLTVSSVTETSATATWQEPTPAPDLYRVQLAVGGGAFTDLGTQPGLSIDLTDLAPGTPHSVQVRSELETGEVSGWVLRSFVTGAAEPAQPSLALKAQGFGSIQATWSPGSGGGSVTGYSLERADGSDPDVEEFAEVYATPGGASPIPTGVADPVTEGQTYTYRVIATGPGGSSIPSATHTVTAPIQVPGGIESISVQVDAFDQVTVTATWSGAGGRPSRIDFYRDSVLVGNTTAPGSGAISLDFVDDELAEGTTYGWTARAWRLGVSGELSGKVEATTPLAPPLPPTAITFPTVQANRIDAQVTPPESGPTPDRFRVQARVQGDSTWIDPGSVPLASPVRSFLSLLAATTYEFRARSERANDTPQFVAGAWTDPVVTQATAAATLPLPTAPRILVDDVTTTTIEYRVVIVPSDTSVSAWVGEHSTDSPAGPWTASTAIADNRFRITGMAPGAAVSLRGAATNATGTGDYSAVLTVQTQVAPGVPTAQQAGEEQAASFRGVPSRGATRAGRARKGRVLERAKTTTRPPPPPEIPG